jgi:PEP-CTERM motif
MTATPKVARWAQGASLALMLALFAGSARGQGTVVFVVPQTPIYYAPVDHSTDIDLNGDGTIDYTLVSDPDQTVLEPHGQNSMVVVPELPPDYGSFVAPLSQGDAVNSTPSSLNPVFAWYDPQTDPTGQSLIAALNTAGPLGYFFDGIHYVGLEFAYGGSFHYGWMEINCFFPSVPGGQVLGWAYETLPDTPISIGQVPEPGAAVLLVLGLAGVCWSRRNGHGNQRTP